jgi:AcrR family transcriptional regulator
MEGILPDARHHMSGSGDRRARRTRSALIEAFNTLVLNRRTRDIRVSDIVHEAKVGRSTFYDHYPSAEALHLDALRRPFAPLAAAAAGLGNEAALTHILTHFWDYRQRARRSFSDRTQRLLAEMVEERLGAAELCIARPLAARQLAASAHAALTAWLAGEASCPPHALATALCRAGKAQADALRA